MSEDRPRSRRSFLNRAVAASVAAPALIAGPAGSTLVRADEPARRPPVIDCHAHLQHRSLPNWDRDDRRLIAAADRLGIDKLCCSTLTPKRPSSAEGFRECNGWTADGIKRFPGRVLGYCYVNPMYQAEALEEIRRRVGEGFIGIKLYNERKCTDPIVAPIVELAIELGVPILHHAGHLHYRLDDQPLISDGGDLAVLASRYPEARLICAHACGGGDWEWTIRALRHAPSVHLDMSGSVLDAGVVAMAAKVLGAGRLLFGCDMSMTAGVGRIRGAGLAPDDEARVMGGNMEALLKGRGS
ncbi:amidohydrolase family protein [Tundrisphaera sp. TA3]|uniref:amidohydrolase family protein n=1 Tax=Tundrisphaera sp. TA3 TaxID=3435775 RepID=UPI003EBC607E